MTNGGNTPGEGAALDRSLLAAFVDGALSPEEAAAVVMHLADHPQDQAYVDDLIAANEALAAAFSDPLHEPVPEAIRAAIMGDGATGDAPAGEGAGHPGPRHVIPFRPRRPSAVRIGWALALAASVAAVAVLVTGRPGPSDGRLLTVGPVGDRSDLARALAGLPALEPWTLADGQQIMVLATVRTADGRYCREVEIVDQAAARIETGIACTRADTGWTVDIALQEALQQDGEGDGFATASGAGPGSAGPGSLEQFLDQQGAGEVLSPEAEALAVGSGWTR